MVGNIADRLSCEGRLMDMHAHRFRFQRAAGKYQKCQNNVIILLNDAMVCSDNGHIEMNRRVSYKFLHIDTNLFLE